MKKLMVAIACFAFILALSPVVMAQMDDQTIWKANVPYTFHVENRELPAGVYLVKWTAGRLTLASENGKDRVNVIALRTEGKKMQEKSFLTFNKYGTEHFLSAIHFAGQEDGHELLKSKYEVELAKKTMSEKVQIVAQR